MRKRTDSYHHGNLAESLLDAVDEIANRFGLEAVTLRACAKRVGVSPSSAFRHYADKRALLTAFACRALGALDAALLAARERVGDDAFGAVALAYIEFALNRPALFRAMWREETIYSSDELYVAAAARLRSQFTAGFAATLQDSDPQSLSTRELLAWSTVHGLANLFVDGPVANGQSREQQLEMAFEVIAELTMALR